jgi:hypothetical protein
MRGSWVEVSTLALLAFTSTARHEPPTHPLPTSTVARLIALYVVQQTCSRPSASTERVVRNERLEEASISFSPSSKPQPAHFFGSFVRANRSAQTKPRHSHAKPNDRLILSKRAESAALVVVAADDPNGKCRKRDRSHSRRIGCARVQTATDCGPPKVRRQLGALFTLLYFPRSNIRKMARLRALSYYMMKTPSSNPLPAPTISSTANLLRLQYERPCPVAISPRQVIDTS